MPTDIRRKLTTILAADAVGYSRAMDIDEVSTLSALRAARDVFSRFIERHHGRIVNTAGDGLLAEFSSVVEAVQCAVEVQRELDDHLRGAKNALRFRIGVHLGDVMIDGTDLLGEGVNLAARLQTMAEPGGVLVSQQVYDQVQHKLTVRFEYLGEKRPKNFLEDVSVYRLNLDGKRRNDTRTKPPERTARRSREPGKIPDDLRQRTLSNAKRLGILWLALVLIDLFTGSPFWAHWPGLVMGTLLALQAVPLLVRDPLKIIYVRGVVIAVALLAINLFSWSGYPWVFWPTGVLIVVALLYRVRDPST